MLARIPLALAEVEEPALTIFSTQFVHQRGGKAAFRGPEGIGIPFCGIAVTHRHKRRLATHGEAHIGVCQVCIDGDAEFHHVGPLGVGIRLGDAW